MAAEHVIVTFTTDSKQLADTMAAEATDTDISCCAHIEGPIRRVERWHGRKQTHEEWRVEVEATEAGAHSLVEHIKANHRDDVHNLVVANNFTHVFGEKS